VLDIAPTPAAAAKLSVSRIAAALRRAGRSRGIDQAAAEIKAGLRKPQLHQPVLVENAMGKQAVALLAVLDTACANVDDLGHASAELFQQHPDHAIMTSFPGLADSTGARVLAEIGDDRARFADARALRPTPDRLPSPAPRAARWRSPTATSRTTGWPASAGCGHSRLPPPSNPPASTTGKDEHTATATPPPTAICSTNSSASSTTAYNTRRPSTRPRHSRHRYPTWPNAALRPPILTTPHRVAMCDRKRDSVSRQ